ncbi:hypothetical protein CHS0354_005185 [Potamilus streckersoni]|uniref:Uncharacterized protein n=1 Tax=Potamilus streckersoni TaxID=2493646 RepID=A0AAE0VGH2_9BIVA|nr:hypothetical protein CHS0354_005185 [Potamilus streckersoni]
MRMKPLVMLRQNTDVDCRQAVAIRVGKLLKKVLATLKRILTDNKEEGSKAPIPEMLDFHTLKRSTTGPEVADEVKRVLIDLLETIDRREEEIND